jgi:hypothetical protein
MDSYNFPLKSSLPIQMKGQERRDRKWHEFIKRHSKPTSPGMPLDPNLSAMLASNSAQLATLVSAGIPVLLRSTLWPSFRSHHYPLCSPPEAFEGLASKRLSDADTLRQITNDLDRTFPGHTAFADQAERVAAGQDSSASPAASLSSVLCAFAALNPSVGYCQGFNLIAFPLSLYFPPSQTFSTLAYVVNAIQGTGYYDERMRGRYGDMLVLQHLVRSHFPALFGAMNDSGLDVSVATFEWFTVMYAGVFRDMEITYRIWDVVFAEGNAVFLFRVALAMLECNEKSLLAVLAAPRDDDDEFNGHEFISNLPKQWGDPDALVNAALRIKMPGSGIAQALKGKDVAKREFDSDVLRLRKHYFEKVCVAEEEAEEEGEEG